MDPIVFIIGVPVIVIAIRVLAGSLDHDRIRADLAARGARVEDIRWTPFATGWLGRKGERSYEVAYVDADGEQQVSTCSTSMLGGVYYRDEQAAGGERRGRCRRARELVDKLMAENARLREENESLRQGRA
ncbi:MAG: hypothetical protein H6810_00565 [Phycisphaeraceae bacterium]|nr:MAG: hypothetical protein H6810_00565 [Phycisphaeraceae bacterium]